jgi:hypothetical protein
MTKRTLIRAVLDIPILGAAVRSHSAYILRLSCPSTSNSAFVICPSEQTRTASISTSNTLPLSITACSKLDAHANQRVLPLLGASGLIGIRVQVAG